MKRVVAIAVLLASVALAVGAQDNRPLVLVFDLKTTHLSKDEMIILVDYIASNLVNSGQYRVIDRRQREQALSEIAFANSDLSEDELRLKVGKFLAANYMLDGSIGAIGDRFLLNLKLVDVNTAETLKTASQRYGNINELIDDSARLTLGMVGSSAAVRPAAPAPAPARPPVAARPAPEPPARPTEPARPLAVKPEPARPAAETFGELAFTAEGTVLDTRAGLEWAREVRQGVTYADGEAYASGLRLGGHSDWRLPTDAELLSLGQTIGHMSGQPFVARVLELLGWRITNGGKGESFWTQTPVRRDASRVVTVDMALLLMGNNSIRGGIGRPAFAPKDGRQDVRAVRR